MKITVFGVYQNVVALYYLCYPKVTNRYNTLYHIKTLLNEEYVKNKTKKPNLAEKIFRKRKQRRYINKRIQGQS